MDQKTFNLTVSLLLLAVALAHLYRCITGGALVVGGHDLPMAVSVFGTIVPGYLSVRGFQLSRKI